MSLITHLLETCKRVAKWPKWKPNLLGGDIDFNKHIEEMTELAKREREEMTAAASEIANRYRDAQWLTAALIRDDCICLRVNLKTIPQQCMWEIVQGCKFEVAFVHSNGATIPKGV